MTHSPRHLPHVIAAAALALLVGCEAPQPPAQQAQPARAGEPDYIRYIPTTQPAPTITTPDLPSDPQDARKTVPLVYSVELWEILLPRNSVSSDEEFWKRVNEQAVQLSTYDVLFKNGLRVGELPIEELETLRALIDERRGQRTQLVGIAGKNIEIPIASGIDRQTLFFFDRSNELVGRSYEKCDNLMYFSFEPTPRRPDRIRLVLTPAVRGANKRLQYSSIPGKVEKELTFRNEEFYYDANLRLDLPLRSVLVIAPSVQARDTMTIGGTFLIKNTPAQQLERLIVIVPRAFEKRDETVRTGSTTP